MPREEPMEVEGQIMKTGGVRHVVDFTRAVRERIPRIDQHSTSSSSAIKLLARLLTRGAVAFFILRARLTVAYFGSFRVTRV